MGNDPVNKPDHYDAGKFECIDVLEHVLSPEEFAGYCKGNVIKYMYRHNYKGHSEQDLQKARWYLNLVLSGVVITPTPEKSTCPREGGTCAECAWLEEQRKCDI